MAIKKSKRARLTKRREKTSGEALNIGTPTASHGQMISCPSFTTTTLTAMMAFPSAKLTCRRSVNSQNKIKIMGDKSPKSNQKKSTQKQSKSVAAKKKPVAAKKK